MGGLLYVCQNHGLSRMTRISRIVNFGIGKLFFKMTACFFVSIFDVFLAMHSTAAEPLKSASSVSSAPIRDSDTPRYDRNLIFVEGVFHFFIGIDGEVGGYDGECGTVLNFLF